MKSYLNKYVHQCGGGLSNIGSLYVSLHIVQ